jgi:hypothetical protein
MASSETASQRHSASLLDESRFQCNVCLDAAKDPVVTQYVQAAEAFVLLQHGSASQMWTPVLLVMHLPVDLNAEKHVSSLQSWRHN